MRIENDVKLDFKDVLIRPKRSTLNSRNAVDITRSYRFYHTASEWKGFPLIAANMDVTGTIPMARALGRHGALTALHKHYPESALIEFFSSGEGEHAFYSLGTTSADLEKLAAVRKRAPVRFVCLDVANGYSEKFLDTVKRVREGNANAVIMAGNVVTGDMTEALILAGAGSGKTRGSGNAQRLELPFATTAGDGGKARKTRGPIGPTYIVLGSNVHPCGHPQFRTGRHTAADSPVL